MARCFCGCGQKVRFGMRSVNRRGAMLRGYTDRVAQMLAMGVKSPNAEMFVSDGQLFYDLLAQAVHHGVDPGPEVEHETRGLMVFGRQNFSEGALGRRLRLSGLTVEDAAQALSAGQLDPFVDIDYPLRPEAVDDGT